MMKTMSLSALCYANIDFDIKDIFPEKWLQRKEFSLYKNKERPCSALFFVCSDIEVTFYDANGIVECTVRNGDIVFIPKGIRYHVSVVGETGKKVDTYTINFTFFDESHNEFVLNSGIELIAHIQNNRQEIHLKNLSDMFHRVIETPLGGKCNLAKVKGEFFQLLDLITASAMQNDVFYYPIKKGVEVFCDEWNQNERIEKYAQLCGMSVTYFYRCFRKWSGYSPVEYRNMLRLSNAESFLRSTDMKIQEISEAIGFDDPFYFSRLFTNAYSMSPKHYREHCQKA